MISRREAIGLMGSMSAAALVAQGRHLSAMLPSLGASEFQGDVTPPLARGEPTSAERLALIKAFKRAADGVDAKFEARTHKSDWEMPYRLFRPAAAGKLPLVMYLHGSGGLGTDNQKQMSLGNVFGTRLWALPATQKTHPCYVVVPQTDRGWMRYGDPAPGDSIARVIPGLGDGARVALEIIDVLRAEFPIDERRIYLTGQSMGGGGVWNMTAHKPKLFAAAVVCCGSASVGSAVMSAGTPLWNFHGDADKTVPVSVSRERIAAMRKAGAHPLSTEYAGVGHNVWEWAYTEPSVLTWLFAQRRS